MYGMGGVCVCGGGGGGASFRSEAKYKDIKVAFL